MEMSQKFQSRPTKQQISNAKEKKAICPGCTKYPLCNIAYVQAERKHWEYISVSRFRDFSLNSPFNNLLIAKFGGSEQNFYTIIN